MVARTQTPQTESAQARIVRLLCVDVLNHGSAAELLELCDVPLAVAEQHLRSGGALVCAGRIKRQRNRLRRHAQEVAG